MQLKIISHDLEMHMTSPHISGHVQQKGSYVDEIDFFEQLSHGSKKNVLDVGVVQR